MLHSSSAIVALTLLSAVAAQRAADNTTAAGTNAAANASTTAPATLAANATPADAATTASSPQSFPAPTVSGTQCGVAQQNFNQCVTKVSKDISNCPSTDNVCLCQTYANLAACYNACAELAAQGQSYQGQSTQYCAVAGVKPNVTSNATVSAPPPSSTPVSLLPSTNRTSTNTSSSTASTFAAKSAASPAAGFSLVGLLTAVSAVAYAAMA